MSVRSSTRTDPLTALLLGIVLACGGCAGDAGGETATFAVAASLRNVMPALVAAYDSGDVDVAVTYGASGSLRMQVEGGAPVDGVLFASAEPVDALIASGLADPGSRRVVATNQLVLIAPKEHPSDLDFEHLADLPPGERLAVGEPGAVPAGRYARQALEALGSWEQVEDRLVYGGDVAMVLAYARRAEVAAAIVYRTDARGIDDVVVLDRARGPWAPDPEVVVATVTGAEHAETAASFLEWLGDPAGRAVLRAHGFGVPGE